jgi:hypothetical protein
MCICLWFISLWFISLWFISLWFIGPWFISLWFIKLGLSSLVYQAWFIKLGLSVLDLSVLGNNYTDFYWSHNRQTSIFFLF